MTTEEAVWTIIAGISLAIVLFCWAKYAANAAMKEDWPYL